MAIPILRDLDMGSAARIVNLLDGTDPQHPATVAQLNAAVEGIHWKDSCLVSTQGNLNLASPGATIDGITPVSGQSRVLVRSQSAPAENGIYIWNGAASAMTRAADCSTAIELEQATTTVEEGTNAGVSYRQTSVNFTLGSGAVAWTVFGASAGAASESSAGILEIATQGETDTGTDDARAVSPLKLATWSGRINRYTALFGDGAATQYDLTHNLGTTQVRVEIFRVSDGVTVLCEVTRTTTNVVRLNFAAAVASNALRALITT